MKKLIFFLCFGFSLSASAQYLGGSGDGDIKTGISSKLLDGTAGTAAWYFGGSGDGDIKSGATNKLLDGTTAVLAWFYGGSGDGDIKSGTSSKTLNGTTAVLAWFYGGSGDGDVKSARLTGSYLGEIEWVGSTSTDWNTTSNWRQLVLPTDGRVKISTTAVRDLNLDQNRTINTLDFNGSGKKVCPGNFNLTVNNGFVGANSTSYVKTTGTGTVKTTLATGASFAFPVGNTDYNPVTITNNTGTADNFSVRVADEVLLGGTSGNAITTPRVNRTWHIDKTNPTANAGAGVDMDFIWNTAQETGTMAAYTLNHYNGNDWVFATGYGGTEQVTGSNPKTLAFSGYVGTFSPFAIGGDPVSPLPIVLQDFTATCAEEVVKLNWITQSEINNERFFIHRSADLIQWEEVLTLPGAGNSNAPLSYTAEDDSPLKGMNYYRLTQQDYDGITESFVPIPVFCRANGEESNTLQVNPNPAEDVFTVSLFVSQTIPEALLGLYDLNGRMVAVRTLSAEKGNNAISFRREGLVSGTYILRLRSEKLALNPVKVVLK